MKYFTSIAAIIATSCLAVATPVLAQSAQEDARFQQAQQRFDNELRLFRQEFDRYQAARANDRRGGYRGGYNDQRGGNGYNDPRANDPRANDPRWGYNDDRVESGYDPSRYYRTGPNYQERVLTSDERIYRGNDGRYYCKRNDGTTGLIVGAVAGGVLGNVIDGGHSRSVGTILGAIIGGAAGQSIDKSNSDVRCR
ncbi:MAG: glycine zipper 2TM domain-containing protein [Sphingomonas sp.]